MLYKTSLGAQDVQHSVSKQLLPHMCTTSLGVLLALQHIAASQLLPYAYVYSTRSRRHYLTCVLLP